MPTGKARDRDEAKRRSRQPGAPALTGDPRTDGALVALARLLAEIAAKTADPACAPTVAPSKAAAPSTAGGVGPEGESQE